MLVQVDDISPAGHQFVWLPHTTYDDLVRHDVVAVPVLMFYARHSVRYDPTLTKLVNAAAGVSKERLSRAYNVCIDRRYLLRIEFGISIPSGEQGRPGQRYTTMCYSRVPITDDVLDDVIASYTPGKFVLIPWGEAVPGVEREKRRVKVVSAEVYSYRGPLKITRDPDTGAPVVTEHAGRRGKRAEKLTRKPPEWVPSMANRTAEIVPGDGGEIPVAPRIEKPTSGATSANTDDPQVAPEVDHPDVGCSTSIKKNNEQKKEDQGPAFGADAFGAPDALRLSGPETSTAAGQGGTDPVDHLTGDQQTARAEVSERPVRALEELAAAAKWTPPVPPPAPHRRHRPPTRQGTRRHDLDPVERDRIRAELEQRRGSGGAVLRAVGVHPDGPQFADGGPGTGGQAQGT